MKNISLLFLATLIFMFSSCKKDKQEPLITKDIINGVAQKGPFLNGTSIGVYELNDRYSPTGKIYTTQILDNTGQFQLNNISLISQYVLLKADGYYFNEVTGANSVSPITLYALTDITNKTSINVNFFLKFQSIHDIRLFSSNINASESLEKLVTLLNSKG